MPDIPSNIVGEAIEKWVYDLPACEHGNAEQGMLGDWMAIACFVSVDSDGRPNAQYYIAMKDGTLLPHAVHGLLAQAREELPSLKDDSE